LSGASGLKWIYPKPTVRVTFGVYYNLDQGGPDEPYLRLGAVNHGPSETTLHMAMARERSGFRKWRYGLLNPLDAPPPFAATTSGSFSGGLPKKLAVGESFSSYFTFDHEALRTKPILDVGFVDVFGRHHWAPRKETTAVRKRMQEGKSESTAERKTSVAAEPP
jgi:hypothetical protein